MSQVGEPAEVSQRVDGSPVLLFITKERAKYHMFVCLPKNWGENQLKGENRICQARGRRGPLSSVFVVDLQKDAAERNTVYSDRLWDIRRLSLVSPLFNPA